MPINVRFTLINDKHKTANNNSKKKKKQKMRTPLINSTYSINFNFENILFRLELNIGCNCTRFKLVSIVPGLPS